MQGLKILGTGSYLPETVITNEDFAKIIDTSDEWIASRTGIRERHYSNKLNFRMAEIAANNAMKTAGVAPEEIDLILVSTCTPDFLYPSMSCLVQNAIGAVNAACIDINCACTGFITALDMARNYMCTGDYKKVLVIASELLTRMLDYEDRSNCILFGDGAGAVVVEPSDKIFYSVLGAQGDSLNNMSLACKITYYSEVPFEGLGHNEDELATIFDTEKKNKFLQMDGKAVYKFAVDAMAKGVEMVCKKAGISADELDLVIPHQANIRIIRSALKAMSVPDEKVYINLEKHGNTSSSCIPMCLDELNREGRLKSGMKLCLVGFGAGLTYGAVITEI